jgi:type II secretory pathway component GspD/PulD (secretin)
MIRTLVLCALIVAAPAAIAQDGGEKVVEIKLGKGMQITELLATVAEITKKPLLYDPHSQMIRGREIGVEYAVRVPSDRVFDTCRSILAYYELILVPVGPKGYESYLVIDSRSTNNIIKNKATFVPYTKLKDYEDKDGMYISTAIPIQHVTNLTIVRTALSTMVSPAGIGRVHETPDKLIVMDFAPTVAAIAKVVRELDTPQPAIIRKMELVRLDHARADEVATVLMQLIGEPEKKDPRRSMALREKAPTRVAPYPRLNAVAIYADEPTREEIKQMIKVLDVPAAE